MMKPPKALAKEIQVLIGAREMKRLPLSSYQAHQRENSGTEVDGRMISLLKANYRHSFGSSKRTPVRWRSPNPARKFARIGEFSPSAPRIKVLAGGVSRIRCSSNSTLARHVSLASVHFIGPVWQHSNPNTDSPGFSCLPMEIIWCCQGIFMKATAVGNLFLLPYVFVTEEVLFNFRVSMANLKQYIISGAPIPRIRVPSKRPESSNPTFTEWGPFVKQSRWCQNRIHHKAARSCKKLKKFSRA